MNATLQCLKGVPELRDAVKQFQPAHLGHGASMIDGTQEDWDIIAEHSKHFNKGLAKRVLDHLKLLDGDYGGFPVDRLTHSLQTATRAHQRLQNRQRGVGLHGVTNQMRSARQAALVRP